MDYRADPFGYLGMHEDDTGVVVRAALPQASRAFVRARESSTLWEMEPIGDALFELWIADSAPFDYVLVCETSGERTVLEDPYRFGPILGDVDVYLIAEGTHLRLWEVLGSHVPAH